MKTIKIFAFIAIAALAMTACNKDKGGKTPSKATVSIVGEWRSTTFEGAEAPFDIYVDFNEDGSYEMYQRIYTLSYERYDGTYAVSGNIVSGSYSDGQSWKCGYKAELSADGNTLTMRSQENVSVTTVYTKTTIPTEVKDEAAATRATDSERFF